MCAPDPAKPEGMLGIALREGEEKLGEFASGMMHRLFEGRTELADTILDQARAEKWPAARVADVLHALPVRKDTWDKAASFGKTVDDAYWKRVFCLPTGADSSECAFAVRKLLAAGAASRALDIAHRGMVDLDTDLLVTVLRAASGPEYERAAYDAGNARTMFEYHVTEVLKLLETRKDCLDEQMAELELAHMPVFRFHKIVPGGRAPKALYRRLASNPTMFVGLIKDAFRPEEGSGIEEAPGGPSDEDRQRAMAASEILNSFDLLPGAGSVDTSTQELKSWIMSVKRQSASVGRRYAADNYIGRLLAHAPLGTDKHWPCEAVRDVFETPLGGDVENAMMTQLLNNRGAQWIDREDGGGGHRDLARKYKRWAAALQDDWPKMAGFLDRMAATWTASGRQWDDLGGLEF
jgi:hypothetical protein